MLGRKRKESAAASPRVDHVSTQDLQILLEHFSKNTYRAKETEPALSNYSAMQKCIGLMQTDYSLFTISNTNGELSGQYPSQIIILEYDIAPHQNNAGPQRVTSTIYENLYDGQKLKDLISKARNARCRARFPVPVILYRSKYICRSATLSGGPEIFGRSGLDYWFYGGADSCDTEESSTSDGEAASTSSVHMDWQLDLQLCDRVRTQDIKLLKSLNVGTIVDFMVEKKKVKFGLNVTSSEKVDKENRYAEFKLLSLPYPGCEFFKDYRDNNYVGEGLLFDWSPAYLDATIYVPEDPISAQLHIEWSTYKNWDLVQMTQNYMKLIIKYLQEGDSGMLIHCISGWDRTPLFISLLRLSLWADGLVHQSLDALQILYLTIAYDWMLFGHHLTDRLSKGEEIFFFCFYMLKHLTQDEFSIAPVRHKKVDRTTEKTVMRTDSELHLEGVMLEQDPRGSNLSLCSTSSSMSTKSQEISSPWMQGMPEEPPSSNYVLENYLMSTSVLDPSTMALGMPKSPQARRTSPVTVPAASRLRQKDGGSSSSLSGSSWQLVTGTGSLKGSDTTSDTNGFHTTECNNSQDSGHTVMDEHTVVTYNPDGTMNSCSRKKRLLKVREIFYHSYASAVGLKFKDGSDSSLGVLLGSIAEKVGLART